MKRLIYLSVFLINAAFGFAQLNMKAILFSDGLDLDGDSLVDIKILTQEMGSYNPCKDQWTAPPTNNTLFSIRFNSIVYLPSPADDPRQIPLLNLASCREPEVDYCVAKVSPNLDCITDLYGKRYDKDSILVFSGDKFTDAVNCYFYPNDYFYGGRFCDSGQVLNNLTYYSYIKKDLNLYPYFKVHYQNGSKSEGFSITQGTSLADSMEYIRKEKINTDRIFYLGVKVTDNSVATPLNAPLIQFGYIKVRTKEETFSKLLCDSTLFEVLDFYLGAVNEIVTVGKKPITGVTNFSGLTSKVYPNPFTDQLQIELPNSQMVRIFDHTGTLIFSHYCTEFLTLLSMKEFPKGLYFVQTSEGSKMEKILKD